MFISKYRPFSRPGNGKRPGRNYKPGSSEFDHFTHLEARSMAAPVFQLNQPLSGIQSLAISGPGQQAGFDVPPPDIEPAADNSNGAMVADISSTWSTADYNSDLTGNSVQESTLITNQVTALSNPTGSSGIGLSFGIKNQATSTTQIVGNADLVATQGNVQSLPDENGTPGLSWTFANSETLGAWGGSVHLHGSLQINYSSILGNGGDFSLAFSSGTGLGLPAPTVNFAAAAAGVVVQTTGPDLVITYPFGGTIHTETKTGFFVDNDPQTVEIQYDTNTTAAGEAYAYQANAGVGVSVNEGNESSSVATTPGAQSNLTFSFSEVVD